MALAVAGTVGANASKEGQRSASLPSRSVEAGLLAGDDDSCRTRLNTRSGHGPFVMADVEAI